MPQSMQDFIKVETVLRQFFSKNAKVGEFFDEKGPVWCLLTNGSKTKPNLKITFNKDELIKKLLIFFTTLCLNFQGIELFNHFFYILINNYY